MKSLKQFILSALSLSLVATVHSEHLVHESKIRLEADQISATTFIDMPVKSIPNVSGLNVVTTKHNTANNSEFRWLITNTSAQQFTNLKIASYLDIEIEEVSNTFFNETAKLDSIKLPQAIATIHGHKALPANAWAAGEPYYKKNSTLNSQFNAFALDNQATTGEDDVAIAFLHEIKKLAPNKTIRISVFAGEPSIHGVVHSDQQSKSDLYVNSVAYVPVNSAPVARDDNTSLLQGSKRTLNILANDEDIDNDSLTIIKINKTQVTSGNMSVPGGTISVSSDQSIVFTSDSAFSGKLAIPYEISDSNGGLANAYININVTTKAVPNNNPIATADKYEVERQQTIILDPLNNDRDPDSDLLKLIEIAGTTVTGNEQVIKLQQGEIVITDKAIVKFIANESNSKSFSFNYKISDSQGGEDTAEIEITLKQDMNNAPVAIKDKYSVKSGNSITLDPLSNDSDMDGDSLVITKLNNVTIDNNTSFITVAGGVFTKMSAGTFSFAPETDFNGDISVDYWISDGKGGEDSASIEIAIRKDGLDNLPPIATVDTYSLDGNEEVILDILKNDSDPDNDTIRLIEISGQSVTGEVQTINLNEGVININSNGEISFTPSSGINGKVIIPYVITDSQNHNASSTITINIDNFTIPSQPKKVPLNSMITLLMMITTLLLTGLIYKNARYRRVILLALAAIGFNLNAGDYSGSATVNSQDEAAIVAEVVFAIDTSGSMSSAHQKISQVIDETVKTLQCTDTDLWINAHFYGMNGGVGNTIFNKGLNSYSSRAPELNDRLSSEYYHRVPEFIAMAYPFVNSTKPGQSYIRALVSIGDGGNGGNSRDMASHVRSNLAAVDRDVLLFTIHQQPDQGSNTFERMKRMSSGGEYTDGSTTYKFKDTGGTSNQFQRGNINGDELKESMQEVFCHSARLAAKNRPCIIDFRARAKFSKVQLQWTMPNLDKGQTLKLFRSEDDGENWKEIAQPSKGNYLDKKVHADKAYTYKLGLYNNQSQIICESLPQLSYSPRHHDDTKYHFAPEILTSPNTLFEISDNYLYKIKAVDPEGKPVHITIKEAPKTSSFNNSNNSITWKPVKAGYEKFMVIAEDAEGAKSSQSFLVYAKDPKPEFITTPASLSVGLGGLWRYIAIAKDKNDDRLYYKIEEGKGAKNICVANQCYKVLDFELNTSRLKAGDIVPVKLAVDDGKGNYDRQTFDLEVINNRAPRVTKITLNNNTLNASPRVPVNKLWTPTVIGLDPESDPITFNLDKAPSGMKITKVDDVSATINWTPTKLGYYNFNIEAWDSYAFNRYAFKKLQVVEPNQPPFFVSPLPTQKISRVGIPWKHRVYVDDPNILTNFDVLRLSLKEPTNNADYSFSISRFNSNTNAKQYYFDITFTPKKVGTYDFTLKLSDGFETVERALPGLVATENTPPKATTTPTTSLIAGQEWIYNFNADSLDGDYVHIQEKMPTGMKKSGYKRAATGSSITYTWTPDETQAGEHSLVITYYDQWSGAPKYTQDVKLMVSIPNHAPKITSSPQGHPIEGKTWTYQVIATDEDGDKLTYSLGSSPKSMKINKTTGEISWTPATADLNKIFNVEVIVSDGMASTTHKFDLKVLVDDNDTPIALITTPKQNSILSGPTDIIGTASDANFKEYLIELFDSKQSKAVYSHTGNKSITNAKLGEFDASTIPNGEYELRLSMTDQVGNTTTYKHNVTIDQSQSSNVAPVIEKISDLTIVTGKNLELTVKASDADSDPLTYSISAMDSNNQSISNIVIDNSGKITWIAGPVDTYSVSVKVSDNYNHTTEAIFNINVSASGVNRAPVAVNDSYSVSLGKTLTIDKTQGLLANDSDPDNDSIEVKQVISDPVLGDVVVGNDGAFTYTPKAQNNTKAVNLSDLQTITGNASSNGSDTSKLLDSNQNTIWKSSATDNDRELTFSFAEAATINLLKLRLGNVQANYPEQIQVSFLDSSNKLLLSSNTINLNASDVWQTYSVKDLGATDSAIENVGKVVIQLLKQSSSPSTVEMADLTFFGMSRATKFTAIKKWQYKGARELAISIPLVADVDADGIPEVLSTNENGALILLSGSDGTIKAEMEEAVVTPPAGKDMIAPISTVMADINNDGLIETITLIGDNDNGRIVALSDSLKVLWDTSIVNNDAPNFPATIGGMAVADLDQDDSPEILALSIDKGLCAIRATGEVWWCNKENTYYKTFAHVAMHQNDQNIIVADINMDGKPEVITRCGILDYSGKKLVNNGCIDKDPVQGIFDDKNYKLKTLVIPLFIGVADVDNDTYPEIIVTGHDRIRIFEHDNYSTPTTEFRIENRSLNGQFPIFTMGGAPTIGDFDNDGQVEIGLATRNQYSVWESNGDLLWKKSMNDYNSGFTASTLFDFEDDGIAEVVYRDQENLYVLRGSDGAELFSYPVQSETFTEYPLVADIDGDGQAEILVTQEKATNSADNGVFAFESPINDWSTTRRIWNQYEYHITNINEDGSVPKVELNNWEGTGLNNYRQNAWSLDEVTKDIFKYQITDSKGNTASASVVIEFSDKNYSPVIISQAVTEAIKGFSYRYEVKATDKDGDVITFSLNAPNETSGLVIDKNSGVLEWKPVSKVGKFSIEVIATDTQGNKTKQSFILNTLAPINIPDLAGVDINSVKDKLEDVDLKLGTVKEVFSDTIPAGEVISTDPSIGTPVKPGTVVNVVVSKGKDPSVTTNRAPAILSESTTSAFTEQLWNYPVKANDIDGDQLIYSIKNAPAGMLVDSQTGLIVWTPAKSDKDKSYTFEVEVSDGQLVDSQSVSVYVHEFAQNDNDDPIALITTPTNNFAVTKQIKVTGSASDSNFAEYKLELIEQGAESGFILKESSTSVSNAELGIIDPMTIANGVYNLRLTVRDKAQKVSVAQDRVLINTEIKAGLMDIAFTDLTLNSEGIPLSVDRLYDSTKRHRKGDFGYGWDQMQRSIQVFTSGVLGKGWKHEKTGGWNASYTLKPLGDRNVYVVFGSGEVYSFKMKLTLDSQQFVPIQTTSVADYEPLGTNTKGQLKPINPPNFNTPSIGLIDLYGDLTNIDIYDPKKFLYVAEDGTELTISKDKGIERIKTSNGQLIEITENGIINQSDPNRSLLFERDSEGRIEKIKNPYGNEQSYVYDSRGDLIEHIDEAGNKTTFEYDNHHGLIKVTNPLNNSVEFTYDVNGRMTTQTDALGNKFKLDYSKLADNEFISTDANGNTTITAYDNDGNITETRTEFTDVDGNKQVAIEKFSDFDSKGNPMTFMDADGIVSKSVSSSIDIPSKTVVDPQGLNLVSENIITKDGGVDRVTAIKDPMGIQTNISYGSDKQTVTSVSNELGQSERYEYDSDGNVSLHTSITGETTTYNVESEKAVTRYFKSGITTFDDTTAERKTVKEFNSKDQVTTMTVFLRDKPTDPLTEYRVINYKYDVSGNIVEKTIDIGVKVTYSYDKLDNLLSEKTFIKKKGSFNYELESETQYEYDDNARLIKTIYPESTARKPVIKSVQYDNNGNIIQVSDRGRVTQYRYDELNRKIVTILPNGSSIKTLYSPGGNVLADIDQLGHRTEYEYDTAGRLKNTIYPKVNAEQLVTKYVRNKNGMVTNANMYIRTTNSSGQIVDTPYRSGARDQSFILDKSGRIEETYVNGKLVSELHHSTNGLVTSVIDANGNTFKYDYSNDNLIKVTEPKVTGASSAAMTNYSYDGFGNMTSKTDAMNKTTTYLHDENGHVIKRILPDSSFESFEYNYLGLLSSRVDALGNTFEYEYDGSARISALTATHHSNSSLSERVEYEYNIRGELIKVSSSGGDVSYIYNDLGQVTSATSLLGTISYKYDKKGQTIEVKSPNQQTNYEYDSMGRLVKMIENGNETAYHYDVMGDLLEVFYSNGMKVKHEYYAHGPKKSMTLVDKNNSILEKQSYTYTNNSLVESITNQDNETESFEYDELGRLLSVKYSNNSGIYNSIEFEYDLIGNRTVMKDGSIIRKYEYEDYYELKTIKDENDSVITSFEYDNAGNRIKKVQNGKTTLYTWDVFGRLKKVTKDTNSTTFTYDAIGNRVGKLTGLGALSYLINEHSLSGNADVLEVMKDGQLDKSYITDGNSNFVKKGNNYVYNFESHLGSILANYDSTGAKTADYTYKPYGETNDINKDQKGYTGEFHDADEGLIYLRSRYYDPEVGLFISRDKFQGTTRVPSTQHPYMYVGNSPTNATDPSGYFSLGGLSISMNISSTLSSMNTVNRFCQANKWAKRLDMALKIMYIGKMTYDLYDFGQTGAFSNSHGLSRATSYGYKVSAPDLKIFGKHSKKFERDEIKEYEVIYEYKTTGAHKSQGTTSFSIKSHHDESIALKHVVSLSKGRKFKQKWEFEAAMEIKIFEIKAGACGFTGADIKGAFKIAYTSGINSSGQWESGNSLVYNYASKVGNRERKSEYLLAKVSGKIGLDGNASSKVEIFFMKPLTNP